MSQGEVEETSRGQISQLNIYQLLSASPQVIYPSGLNGHDKPIITTLPEPLSSSKSVIANEHSYLEIDISSKREWDTKALLIGEASIILKTAPPKSSPEPKCSMSTEVDNLLDSSNGRHIQLQIQTILPREDCHSCSHHVSTLQVRSHHSTS